MRRLILTHRRAITLIGLSLAAILAVHLWLFAGLPDVDAISAGLLTPSIRITDRHGRLLFEVIGEAEGRHNVVPLSDIPQSCRDATIATEDASFYANPGFDLRGVARAVWINLQGGEVISGGSTITQQVVRNLLFDPEERARRTLRRKLREVILAYRLTQRLGKDEILALYLNQTYYGNLAYGIDAASRAYFGEPVAALDLAECALLAGLPQAPALYDPLSDPEAAEERQAVVLGLMAGNRMITAEQAEQAGREPLAFAAERYPILAPHFVHAVYAELQEILPPETLYAGGLEVRTTLDLDWQEAAARIAQRHLDLLNTPLLGDPPHNAHNAALVALDPATGQVLVMMGNPDPFDAAHGGAVNMALAPRQPGSALKPFTYAAAFDPARSDAWTAATMILDVRTAFVTREGFSYVPVNYDGREHGPVLAREALASSYNIPAVVALRQIGMDGLLTTLGRLGVTTLDDPSAYDLSLTLGGGEVRLLELTAAYAVFATGGRSVRPVLILDVRDAAGDVIYAEESGVGAQVIDPRVAWLITDILSDNNARAPTFTTHSILQIGRPAAVKTGTTTDYRDNWTVGYTPDLVVGVWVGNTSNKSMYNITGVSGAGPIWHHFMRLALRGRPELAFERPEGVVQAEVCALSGLLPTQDCPYTRTEWFIAGTGPTETDNLWRRVVIDTATGLLADESTPAYRRAERLVVDLPPQAHDWARSVGLLTSPPNTAGERGSTAAIQVVSPDANSIYRIAPGLPLDAQRIRIAVVGQAGLHDVTIYVDGAALATVPDAPFEMWWTLAVGAHEVYAQGVTAEGEIVRSETVRFTVRPAE